VRLSSLVALAARRLARRPFRSLLLLQGTVWGIAVAIFPTAVISGTRQAAQMRGESLGADRIAIAPDPTAQGGSRLDANDVAALRSLLEEAEIDVKAVGGARVLRIQGEAGREGAVVEAAPATPAARGLELARGRWLRSGDEGACVVEAEAGRWLSGRALAPGDEVTVDLGGGEERPFRVVGVTKPRTAEIRRTNDLGFDVEHPLFEKVGRNLLYALGIPYVQDDWKRSDGVVYLLPRSEELDWIFLRVDTADVKRAARLASEGLVRRNRATVTLHPLVLPLVMSDEIDRFAAVQLAMFLACLAMGAVVMANLGLLTVLRRSREIAIRRVEGATRRDVGLHFLLEGLLLTAVGCVLGVVLGMALAQLRVSLEPVTGFTWAIPWKQSLIACTVALLIGALASALPALRAGAQEPVEGLIDD
jgi:hypothetical protein